MIKRSPRILRRLWPWVPFHEMEMPVHRHKLIPTISEAFHFSNGYETTKNQVQWWPPLQNGAVDDFPHHRFMKSGGYGTTITRNQSCFTIQQKNWFRLLSIELLYISNSDILKLFIQMHSWSRFKKGNGLLTTKKSYHEDNEQ